jgi:uncharacterized membrane protein YkoI
MTEEMLEPRPNRRIGLKIALVGAGLAAGAIGATAIGANAETSTPAATTQTSTAAGPTGSNDRPANAHGAAPVRSDEKAVSAAVAAKLKAAALKSVPGGTVYRVETDAGDAVYEAHMTKADGSEVTVKFDKNYQVTGVESGMGKGDPGGPRK